MNDLLKKLLREMSLTEKLSTKQSPQNPEDPKEAQSNLTPNAERMAVKLGVKARNIELFNECTKQFQADVEANCPEFRILGLLVAVPNEEGTYGVLIVQGPKITYEGLTQVIKEMGVWMEKFQVQ
jgi:hypothetical protein